MNITRIALPQFGHQQSPISNRAKATTESVIRSVTREAEAHNAINLGQGTPDGEPPKSVIEALKASIISPSAHKYTNTWGIPSFRKAIAEKYSSQLGYKVDADKEVTVTCGATEAMKTTIDALVNPGDEVVLFEPYYDNFTPNIIAAGGKPVYVKMTQPNWQFNVEDLKKSISSKTKAIIINNPQNPTGKVFSKNELLEIANVCKQNNLVAITDEIYENILFDGKKHQSIAKLEGMKDRTVIISGLSKSYNATGWRVGYTIAPAEITNAIRSMHDFTTLCVSEAYQKAGESALSLEPEYCQTLAKDYEEKRDFMVDTLAKVGFKPIKPDGAYFIMAEAADVMKKFNLKNDIELKDFLIKKIGIAVIPGSNFYSNKDDGKTLIRLSFCKDMSLLKQAAERLLKLKDIS